MVKKTVLVTGGSGYIGARLCLHLAHQGYKVTALCHSMVPDHARWVSEIDQVIVGDIRDEEFLSELAKQQFDILIHLVSLDHNQSNAAPSKVSSVNVTPVWSLLDAFSKQGLKNFIYFSTAQVYGPLKNEKVTELTTPNTQTAYALTHQIGEVICEHYNRISATDCRVIRLSNSYGAPIFKNNNCWWLVINDLCKMAYLQREIVLQSDGTPLRDFIHGDDVCSAVQLIIETSEPNITYNISSGTTLSIMEIAQKIKKVFLERYNLDLPITAKKSANSLKPVRYKLDNSLVRSLGFELKWSLEAGINDLFDFLEINDE